VDKSKLSETDICEKFISPALAAAGWSIHEQILREYPLRPGRMVVRGQKAFRDKRTVLRADYVLFWKGNIPLAVIEAKDNNHAVGAGMHQAISYGELLDVPFAFTSNGDGFVFRDATLGTGELESNLGLDAFPSPKSLWLRLCAHKGWTPEVEAITSQDYAPSKTPRYYQIQAINRTVEAIARGQRRVLLVMATGTGKTYTAFQIIHRLWKSPWRADKPSGQKRILFLADRNILIDQTMVNDFRPFKGAMAKLSPNAKGIERVDSTGTFIEELDLAVSKATKQVDKSYEIYLSLYQAVSGTDEESNIYKQFSPDFFDLIVVDECHRGSADEDSAWREILDYFSGATQIGLTATPKETKDISNTEYFGEPVYTYSLKQGIDDGYPTVAEEEAPFDIPASWAWVRLGNLSLTSDSGWSPQCASEARVGTNWGVLKVSAVSWGVFKPDENKALPAGLEARPECEVRTGDFLISRANTEELVARSVLVTQTPPKLMMSDKIVRFSFPDEVNREYINLANGCEAARAYYARNASGTSSSMKNVGREVMCNLPIPFPPLPQQSRIVARVRHLFGLVDQLESGLDAARSKAARMLAAVLDELTARP
jgi:hypothetical protein